MSTTLVKTNIQTEQLAVIIAAHGSSKDERINRPLLALAKRVKQASSFKQVAAAFLDGQPDIRTIIDEIEPDQITVIPFMASAGYYTDIVFPKALAKPGKTVNFTDPIGVHADLPNLVGRRIQTILQRDLTGESTVVVIGHGTRKNKDSCRSTIDLVQRLRTMFVDQRIEFAFIDQDPTLEHVANRITTPTCILIPFLMGLGPHATKDVPVAFGMADLTNQVLEPGIEFPITETIQNASDRPVTIIFDTPVGTYNEWADICIGLATEFGAKHEKADS